MHVDFAEEAYWKRLMALKLASECKSAAIKRAKRKKLFFEEISKASQIIREAALKRVKEHEQEALKRKFESKEEEDQPIQEGAGDISKPADLNEDN